MPYQIRFENQSSASAPAQRVTVTDTLDPSLDLDTLVLTEITFADQSISVPAVLNHYEAMVPFKSGTNDIQVEVQAVLDVPTRVLTLTLTALDPNTGWYPEDPLTGFLYPNNTNHVGEGSITYLVRPASGLATGTIITNRARIVFDYSDAIDTPLVLNTIDADPPVSAVAALPAAVTNASFRVSWSGTDIGSGIVGYDVYYSTDPTNSGSWIAWQQNTTNTSAFFFGVDNTTYGFYAVARDGAGNYEPAHSVADTGTITPSNSPPALDPIPNQVIDANQALVLTNFAHDALAPGEELHFTVLSAPVGAGIDNLSPTNAIFVWTPACEQGGTTNLITVQVSDNGTPPLSTTQSFLVVVQDCVQVRLGRTVVRAGNDNCISVELLSTVQLTNAAFAVVYPSSRLDNFVLLVNTQQVQSSLFAPVSDGLLQMTLNPATNLVLRVPTNIASLCFTTLSNQSSAFVRMGIPAVDAQRADGTTVANAYGLAGRIVVVGEEPLLEALRAPTNLVLLLQYALPGSTVEVQWTTNLPPSSGWQPSSPTTQTNLVQEAGRFAPDVPALFFRAIRK